MISEILNELNYFFSRITIEGILFSVFLEVTFFIVFVFVMQYKTQFQLEKIDRIIELEKIKQRVNGNDIRILKNEGVVKLI